MCPTDNSVDILVLPGRAFSTGLVLKGFNQYGDHVSETLKVKYKGAGLRGHFWFVQIGD